MVSLWNDIRYAVRQMRKSPWFTLTALGALALGLGASSTIYCLMDGLWLHPMQVPDSHRIVRVFSTTAQTPEGSFTYAEYRAMAEGANAFRGSSAGLVALGRRGSLLPRPDGTSTTLLTNVVSENFFATLGVQPAMGRVFTAADTEELRTRPAVLLSHRFWQREFGADPHVVGRHLALRHGRDLIRQVDIWGVLPASFGDIDPNGERDLWMPIQSWAAVVGPGDLTSPDFRWFQLLGRLAPGATAAQANREVDAIAGALASADPAHNSGRRARAISDGEYRWEQAGATGLILMAIVGGVVLLATLNVAQLLLARALSRRREVALRLSLGGTRRMVFRQLVVENVLLCFFGLLAGLAVAATAAFFLPRFLVFEPEMLASYGSSLHFRLREPTFQAAAGLALCTALLLSFIPLSQVSRNQLLPSVQRGGDRETARTSALRRVAIWIQIGISFALLVSTGTLVRSFLNTRTKPIGITRNQVLVAFTQEPDAPMREAVLQSLAAVPGVRRAAYAIRSPLMPSEGGLAAKVLIPSHPELRVAQEIKYDAVSAEFLDVIGTRVIRGRGFTAKDDAAGPAVVLISRAMAERYWPGANPIGQRLRLPAFNDGRDVEARIVGVAEDVPINRLGELPEPYLYLPFHLSNMGEITFVVETRQNAMALAQDVRNVFVRANPLLDPMLITSLPECIRASAGNYQMVAELVSALGLIALVLTILGLYGFLAFRVGERRREIGIRMALGASRQSTAALVLRDTAGLTLAGLAIGLALAIAAGRLESSVLFGVQPLEAGSVFGALAVFAIAAAIGSWLPARHAASIEPMQALRTE